jgi:hypothetical protein
MSLAAMQRDFRAWLLDASSTMQGRLVHAGGLDVYHNAYRVQLVDCLRETFEKLAFWLGEDAFVAAARTHIEQNPPHGWTLGVYGEGFDRTLAALYGDDPEVAELARLEWMLCRAFDGPDAQAASAATLGPVDWDLAVFELVPTFQMANAQTNASAIWSALSAHEPPPGAARLPKPGALLVWRQDFTPCFRSTDAVERDALEKIAHGMSFGELCAHLVAQLGPDAGVERAGALLGQWLQDGLIRADAA